jgi:hypothetical protein
MPSCAHTARRLLTGLANLPTWSPPGVIRVPVFRLALAARASSSTAQWRTTTAPSNTGSRRGKNRAKVEEKPSGGKQPPPLGADPDAIAHEPLSWHLAQVDFAGQWSWAKLDSKHLSDLHKKLLDYERLTLATLKRQHRARQIPTADLCRAAQNRLAAIKRDDTELWELRLGHHKWRTWGAIRGSIFYFLWWDPEHTVCRQLPKGKPRP